MPRHEEPRLHRQVRLTAAPAVRLATRRYSRLNIESRRMASSGGKAPSARSTPPGRRACGTSGADFFVTRLEAMVGWARKNSLWPFPFATACCGIEFMSVAASHYDISRFGSEVVRFSPRQADLLIVAGTVTDKMAPVLRQDLRPDARAEVGHLDGRLRVLGRLLPRVPRHAGHRRDHPGRRLRPRLPADARGADLRDPEAAGEDRRGREVARQPVGAVRGGTDCHDASSRTRRSLRRRRSCRSASRARRWPAGSRSSALDLPTLEVAPAEWPALARFLRDDPECRYDLFLDLCGVDNLRRRGPRPRFEVVVHLHSLPRNEHVRVRIRLPRARTGRRCRPSRASGPRPTGSSARRSTCSGSTSPGIRTCTASSATTRSSATRCARTTRRASAGSARRRTCACPSGRRTRTSAPPLRDADDLDRPVASGDARDHPPDRASRRREDRPRRDDDRLPAPLLREDVGDAQLEPDHPVQRPAQLLSAMINDVGFCARSRRCSASRCRRTGQLVRMILSEFSRIMDHCVCIGANLVDIGALTNFWYLFQNREKIYDLLEACCGARLTVSYVRVGGLAIDVPDDFVPRARRLLETIPGFLDDVEKLVDGNRIVRNRLAGTGVVTREQAIAWGMTGPDAARVGRAVRRPPRAAVRLLRQVRLGRSDLARRRQLRALPGPHGGDAPVAEDHPAGARHLPAERARSTRTTGASCCRRRTPSTTTWNRSSTTSS